MHEFLARLRRALHPPDGTEPTDAQLLARYAEHREDDAFAALVQRHGPMVFGVCRRALAAPDAEDAFQATFLVLARRAGSVSPPEQLAAWLYGVARRTALKSRERGQRRCARERPVSELPDAGAVAEPPNELLPVLDEELERLPPKYRAPVVLCDVEGLTREEAARRLGWVVGTLSWRLAAARKLLADRLARRGIGLPVAVLASAAGAAPPAVGAPSSEIVSLAEEVLSAMSAPNLRLAAGALCVTLIAGACAALVAAPPEPPKGAPKAEAPVARGEPTLRATLNHSVRVLSLAYSSDGKTLASAGAWSGRRDDQRRNLYHVRLWNTATNEPVRTIEQLAGPIHLIRFAPNGHLLIGDAEPQLWDAAAGKELGRFKGHTGNVESVAFHPQGRLMATGAPDGSVRVWDVTTFKEVHRIGSGSRGVTFTPDGKTLAHTAHPGVIKLWDVARAEERGLIRCGDDQLGGLVVHPGGEWLAYPLELVTPTGPDYSIRIVSVDGKELKQLRGHTARVYGIALSADGKLLASYSGLDRSVRVWDVGTGEQVAAFTDKWMFAVAFSPDGNTLALGADNSVKLWDISALRKRK